jgi:hypothetical protein
VRVDQSGLGTTNSLGCVLTHSCCLGNGVREDIEQSGLRLNLMHSAAVWTAEVQGGVEQPGLDFYLQLGGAVCVRTRAVGQRGCGER